jgi:hypothetical protein
MFPCLLRYFFLDRIFFLPYTLSSVGQIGPSQNWSIRVNYFERRLFFTAKKTKENLMKKNIKCKFLFILIFILSSVGCGSVQKDKIETLSPDPFVGNWLVTDFKMKKIPSRKFINTHVTIKSDGKYYYVSGLDGAIEMTAFVRNQEKLEGDSLADLKQLKESYPEIPPAILSQALGDVKYRCSIVFDGRGLIAERANAQIHYDLKGYYKGYTPLKGYFSWYLEKH